MYCVSKCQTVASHSCTHEHTRTHTYSHTHTQSHTYSLTYTYSLTHTHTSGTRCSEKNMSARAAFASATSFGRAWIPCKLVTACCTSPNATGLFGGALQAYATTNKDGSTQNCAGKLVLACCTSPNATGLFGGALQAYATTN